jgi:hypothetical protein
MAKRKKTGGPELFTSVNDELYDELLALRGQRLVHVSLWEDSLADELTATVLTDEHGTFYDLDLYLEEGVYFEFYGASGFPTLHDEPIEQADELQRTLLSLVNQNATLLDIAVDEDDNLVLVLGRRKTPRLYVVAGGWLPGEWEELPGA